MQENKPMHNTMAMKKDKKYFCNAFSFLDY